MHKQSSLPPGIARCATRLWSRGLGSGEWLAIVAYASEGFSLRFVVTSLPTRQFPQAPGLYSAILPKGEMENRFKEQQLELFSDRTSTHTFKGNQLISCRVKYP
jgi:hypothetical protein